MLSIDRSVNAINRSFGHQLSLLTRHVVILTTFGQTQGQIARNNPARRRPYFRNVSKIKEQHISETAGYWIQESQTNALSPGSGLRVLDLTKQPARTAIEPARTAIEPARTDMVDLA